MWYTEQEKRDEIQRMTLEYLELGYPYEEARSEAQREWQRMFAGGVQGGDEHSDSPPSYIVRPAPSADGVVLWTPPHRDGWPEQEEKSS